MKRFLGLTGLLFFLSAVTASATCPPVRRVVVAPVIATPVAVVVPTYAASFGYASNSDVLLQQILDELKGLKGELQGQRSEPVSFASIVSNRCAACHSEGKEAAGGGYVLLGKDGQVVPLSIPEKKLIALRVSTSDEKMRMPPNSTLSERDMRIVQAAVKVGG